MNDKPCVYLLISSTCAVTLFSLYLAYRIKKKEQLIAKLQNEIVRLNREINSHISSYDQNLNGDTRFSYSAFNELSNSQPDNVLKHISSEDHLKSSEDIFFDSLESFDEIDSYKLLADIVEKLEKDGDTNYLKAYQLLSQYEFQVSNFYCLKAKFSRYLARMDEEKGRNDLAEELFYEAHKFAKIAEDIDPTSPTVMKWRAITVGDLSIYMSLPQRVKNALLVKEYAEKCLASDEKDPVVLHLLGRWHHKVASLNWFEIRAARSICSQFPATSLENALEFFLRAERLMPDTYMSNILYIAKCYIEINPANLQEAYHWLQKGLKLQIKNADDRKSYAEIHDILNSNKF